MESQLHTDRKHDVETHRKSELDLDAYWESNMDSTWQPDGAQATRRSAYTAQWLGKVEHDCSRQKHNPTNSNERNSRSKIRLHNDQREFK